MKLDRVLEGPPAPELSVRSVAELVFGARPGKTVETPDAPVILGCLGRGGLDVSLAHLRGLTLEIARQIGARGLSPGDTVCLARLPRTSEAVCAVACVALSAAGLRVLFPMYLEAARFGEWLRRCRVRAVLWSAAEVEEDGTEADRALLSALRAEVGARGLPEVCLLRDLALADRLRAPPPPPDAALAAELCARAAPDDECLVLTTSGSNGLSKLVRYRQGALLRSCAAWEAAGLFARDRLGGRGLALLLAHSMGVRALWNALWTREPVCLVTPEWFTERPELVRAQLLRMRPEHVTGGPAAFRVLLELARVFPELKSSCFAGLRCAVSTGAAFDPELARRLRDALGVELANALGTTETMQVTSALAGAGSVTRPDALGPPLPGVRLGLAREPGGAGEREPETWRLSVSTPFGFAGYVAEEGEGRESLGLRPRSVGGQSPPPPADGGDPEWIDTGDRVVLDGADLVHAGRGDEDFVKDGFGAKIPLARVAGWYAGLDEAVDHVAFAPLREEPGLAAVLFVRSGERPGRARGAGPERARGALVERAAVLDRARSALEARHERLRDELDELEWRHFTIARFACVEGDAPRTAKGSVDAAALRAGCGPLLDRLCGRFVKAPGIVALAREPFERASYVRVASPRRGELMRLAGLDRSYVRGRGDRLTWAERGREGEVLDLVGGFGVNLLGHRHPEVVAAAAGFVADGGPFLADQGSRREHEGRLARRLAMLVGAEAGGHFVVRFASTGAEAVELALAHAAVERDERWRELRRELVREHGGREPERVRELLAANEALLHAARPRVLALEKGFHGHTLGARALLSSPKKRAPFEALFGLETIFLPADGSGDLEAIVRDSALPLRTLRRRPDGDVVEEVVPFSRILAAFAEPIQGEGGVRVVDPALLRRLSGREFPLVLDEIQSGLGRTGDLLASRGVRGDYYLLGKALGGGIAKVAALLVDRSRYRARFDELHSSTFAGDAFSCAVAERVLDVLERDRVPARARERGAALRAALEEVRAAFPDVVKEIRGRGLLLGVELDARAVADGFLLRAAAERELLGVLAASYLLNEHRIRVLPTLSAPLVLRIQPSAYVDDAAIGELGRGLSALCRAVRDRDLAALLSPLVKEEQAIADGPVAGAASHRPVPILPARLEPPAPGAARVAFLAHFVLPERELAMVEPSLARLTLTARRALFHRLGPLLELKPLTVFGANLLGGRVHFTYLVLPADVALLEELHRRGDRGLVAERIQEAADLAARMGCGVVALGAYTSIVTADGRAVLPPPGVRVTSGNSLTVALGARRLLRACADAGVDPARATLAIVGATGNIGRGLAHRLLARGPFRRALLVGRRMDALEAVRAALGAHRSGLQLEVATELRAMGEAQVIAVATNSNEPIVRRAHLAPGRPTVIVDLSVPSAVAPDVREAPGAVVVPFSGTLAVPGEPGFVLASHIRPGTSFACAAEAMLLGLEPEATAGLALTGDIDPGAVEVMEGIAEREGFFERVEEGGFRDVGG